jgi:secretion/DNA translocation related TadE-like protein
VKGDSGSASVLMLGAAALTLAVSVPVVLTASLLATHRQAVRAADLAALAGAQHSLQDAGVSCVWAQRVASANGAQLSSCALSAGALTVGVEVATGIGIAPWVTATARAGLGA